MRWLFRLIRNTVFVSVLLVSLATATVSLAIWTISLTTQVATLTASAAAAAVSHRKAMARVVAKTKAKARLRRVIAIIPFAGVAAAVVFERQDFLEWQEENPGGEFDDYACEVATLSGEVADEVLQDLPEDFRPSRDFVLSQLPACEGTS